MSVSPRVQCFLIAAALLPCVAAAQSSSLAANSPDMASQLSATPIVAPVAAFDQPVAVDVGNDASVIPAPNLAADPIPTDPAPAESAPASPEAQAVADGPTANSATSGFHASNEHLTQTQLAERANHRDQDSDHSGLGRDAVLMIIGGAAIVAGAIVGGGGGTALIVVGAVIGITGLVLVLSR